MLAVRGSQHTSHASANVDPMNPMTRMRTHAATATVTDDELHHIAELIERGGRRTWAHHQAHRRATTAIEAIERANIPPGPATELQALAHSVVDRQA